MTTINFTTLFTNPLNNIAFPERVGFRGNAPFATFPIENVNGNNDGYISNPLLSSALDLRNLKSAMESQEVQAILRENKLPNKLNKKAIETITPHVNATRTIASKMASYMGINSKDIQEAALLHDIGKTLIPEKILGKKGCFTEEEKKIMDLHSELGYALLKQMKKTSQIEVNENVLRLVKYHHQKPDGTGYPQVGNDFEFDIETQILEAADKYSALTEDRLYHKACTREEALDNIRKTGVISDEVFKVLEIISDDVEKTKKKEKENNREALIY